MTQRSSCPTPLRIGDLADEALRATSMTYGRIVRTKDFAILGRAQVDLILPRGPETRSRRVTFCDWVHLHEKFSKAVRFKPFRRRTGVNYL